MGRFNTYFQREKIQNKLTEGVGFPWMIHVRWASLFSPEWTLSVSSSISGGSAKIVCNLRFQSFFLHRQKAYRHSCVQYFLPRLFILFTISEFLLNEKWWKFWKKNSTAFTPNPMWSKPNQYYFEEGKNTYTKLAVWYWPLQSWCLHHFSLRKYTHQLHVDSQNLWPNSWLLQTFLHSEANYSVETK